MKISPCSSRSKAADILYFFSPALCSEPSCERNLLNIVLKTTVTKLSLKVVYKNTHKLALINQLNKWLSWIIYIFSVHCFIYSKLKVSLTFRQSVLWFNTVVLSFFQLSKNSQMFFSSNSWLIRIRNPSPSHSRTPALKSFYHIPQGLFISINHYLIDATLVKTSIVLIQL